jgi:hypothetical protein
MHDVKIYVLLISLLTFLRLVDDMTGIPFVQ